ncbi:exodeoxyribonuclease VII small subunit [Sphingobacterium litopenaei]|uniref:Exodeoxyribonuclease VII small subunit n=1 Tax=Sphingobacterium litopenaei TaxID=2763500 RepID=A0ABR7YHZ6_9SPHI|nr:exodeoxyribonuclease VII small subunit [Sphingobacterium litopenaei]MBD1430938.1 exodeoxyribonuclease VII small subunit [Sphingobacterium litopenaei]
MESNYTYIDAFNELQQIVSDIEAGDVNVDELAQKIKRASELIAVCTAKLIASEEEVDRLLNQLTTETEQNIFTEEE